MKTTFLLLLCLWLLLPCASLRAAQQLRCPVMTGEQAKDKFYVDAEGERIHLCCRSCIRKFHKNPRKYLAVYRSMKAAEDPGA